MPTKTKKDTQIAAATPVVVPNNAKKPKGKVPVRAKLKNGKPVTVLMETDDLVREQVGGFVNFLREYSVVGLAIGFVAGAQAQSVVKALIDSFITPAMQLFIRGGRLENRTFYLSWGNGATFQWGKIVYALINLLFILGAIYLIVKVFKLDKLQKPKADTATATSKTDDSKSQPKTAKK